VYSLQMRRAFQASRKPVSVASMVTYRATTSASISGGRSISSMLAGRVQRGCGLVKSWVQDGAVVVEVGRAGMSERPTTTTTTP
jgi:hypothetical protein